MIEIYITNTTKTKVSKKDIDTKLRAFLEKHKVPQNSEISVSIVSKDEMFIYVKTYLKEEGDEAASHPVLSFVQNELEGPFKNPPDNINHLGEIIVSLDHAENESHLYELIEHGALHLLGIHHK